ncbi:hypothetical protein [Streptomyces sp. NPDC001404]|uniref:hypothetical protein n=1 Tax=Streptomyces sp. NPDC001404 TaxID=3364571 RepID=UPI0036CB2938
MATTHGILTRRYDSHPALGRHQVLDARSLAFRHHHDGETLRTTLWQPRIPVLDQQDLFAQGIHLSTLVEGATDADALGSCTGNAAAAALSLLLSPADSARAGLPGHDAAACEEWAIQLYADATRDDEFLNAEWPPTDSGSSGLGVARALKKRGLIGSYRHAFDADAIANALQQGPVLIGLPWFNAWFEPGPDAFIDAVPDWATSGIAGGHEVAAIGLEEVAQDAAGQVIPERTVLRLRNSWSSSWGADGDFFMRLSTYNALRPQMDAVQLHA